MTTLVLALAAACSLSTTATDTTPTNLDDARQLAQTVASKGQCGGFEDLGTPAASTWEFTCQKDGSSFEITAYGSEKARSAGIASLDARHATYLTKNSYSVTVVSATGSMDSALIPFKN